MANDYGLPISDVDFKSEEHIYTLKGYRLPSVTEIMTPLKNLVYGSDINPVTMYEAGRRGTLVHEQIEAYIEYGVFEQDESTEPYMTAYVKFENDIKPKWIATEYRTSHKAFGYAGTVDLIGFVEPDDDTGVDVVDIKTTAVFYENMLKAQVGAYAEAIASQGVKVRNRYGLQLLRDGTYRFQKLDNGFKLFLHCLAVWIAGNEDKHKGGY